MKECFIILIIFQLLYYSISQDRLVFLYTHYRHGARAPLAINDTFHDRLGEYWDNPGELTGVGQRMHYILGLRNREKYIKQEKFLSEKFDPHEIYIHSSNVNRTMVSCSSQLQGFFPARDQLGYTLTEDQKSIAYPPGDISDDVKNAVNDLGNVALPNQMTLAPVRMINDNDREMKVYDIGECAKKRKEVRKQNNENIEVLKEYIKNFNAKYAESWNKFFNKEEAYFELSEIYNICDSFLSDNADKREMKEFKEKTGLNFTLLNEDCFDFHEKEYLYSIHGDEGKILAHVDSSKLLSEELYFMKRRLDADITPENEDANLKDFSRPKMLMISGHDSTTSADIIFILTSLGLDYTKLYHFPRYASQLSLEVRTSKSKCSSYSDYYILGILDQKQLFNVNAQEFINKIEDNIWSEDIVNEYCGFGSSTSDDIDFDEDKKDNAKTAYKVLMIVFICLAAILLATTILFAVKYCNANKSVPPIDPRANYNQNNVTENSIKNFN